MNADLEVEMRSDGTSGVADESDGLPGEDLPAEAAEKSRLVRI